MKTDGTDSSPAEHHVDSLRKLKDGGVHDQITHEMVALGAQVKSDSEGQGDDVLERYRRVPLHAIFLYTSEDVEVGRYILDNWGALDTLSGEYCDIHPTFDQFRSAEDAYDFVEKLDVVRNARFREFSKLPGLFFWDTRADSEFVSFSSNATVSEIRRVIRTVFEEIHNNPSLESVRRAKHQLMKAQHPSANTQGTMSPQYTPSSWERGVAVSIAVMIFLLVGWLVIRNQPFADPNLVVLLRIVLSVAAGILGATIPGFLHVDWQGKGMAVRAGGALALFFITYSLSPAVVPL